MDSPTTSYRYSRNDITVESFQRLRYTNGKSDKFYLILHVSTTGGETYTIYSWGRMKVNTFHASQLLRQGQVRVTRDDRVRAEQMARSKSKRGYKTVTGAALGWLAPVEVRSAELLNEFEEGDSGEKQPEPLVVGKDGTHFEIAVIQAMRLPFEGSLAARGELLTRLNRMRSNLARAEEAFKLLDARIAHQFNFQKEDA